MTNRLLLTLALILLAAAAAAALIALLLSRPAPSPAAPRLTLIAETIVDAETGQALAADVYLNGALLYQGVSQFQVTVPLDGSVEIRVTAPGYHPWGLRPRGGGTDKRLAGPIRLQRE